ncbi:Hsp20/alpha crystallin family protein [Zobellia galactanivorans]|uniref:Small heat shock protein n=1 Tax=Zobellia galactanivorans (strain DSM 12802 / CCUG 47099 / CIP 106680 / NCIMB 13871 / Dsij) TaxID=63186 RepID=G0L7V4_ZOBGA|nr:MULTISPECIES: Hsp20/alpha crystallin family protein [Zobellia]MBU3024936.1 Hsp20/alpha crystallin family protein [Zobellia galactanivorans]MDO6808765.1 Hsp20/alpha crystallin family protein [Zobellia galactanivorans]OWW25739.1 heat-shock protein [Zobellia sp. OII3]CAZ98372.1 Small heat shock protein [Zobellia galactanivorans]
MSTLVKNAPEKGGLTRTNSTSLSTYPMLSSWVDDLFTRDWPSVFSQNFNTGISLPMVNIKETPDAFSVDMAVPGLNKSNFHIDLDNQVLSISAEITEENEAKDEKYTRREFGYSSFKRSFTLPETVDDSQIKANYQEGILSVYLPKKEEAKKKPPKRIAIA